MGDNTPRNIGLPMLIVVLVSICLFSFSGIAYSTAKHSFEQSNALMERTKNYYAACNEAEEMLDSLQEAPVEETTYAFPFGTAMEELQVTIKPHENDNGYDITGWVISDTASWEAPGEGSSSGGPQAPEGEGASSGGPQPPKGE
ncbi:MAG: hypothetical protein K5668_08455 [Lachnospiraceae bacterium]|nr:hypothetical protein [Lachnospiraceae bacterium]